MTLLRLLLTDFTYYGERLETSLSNHGRSSAKRIRKRKRDPSKYSFITKGWTEEERYVIFHNYTFIPLTVVYFVLILT
jgi:hypothetical protein